jgi:hypothetical protein
VLGPPGRGLGHRDLVERATEVYCRRGGAGGGPPRDRPGQRPVELERGGSVTECGEAAAIGGGEPVTDDRQELPGRHVEEHRPRGRQVGGGAHRAGRLDRPAEVAQARGERVGDGAGPAPGDRPPSGVPGDLQGEPDGRRRRGVEREDRVGGVAGEERARPFTAERRVREPAGRAERAKAEAREEDRVPRQPRRMEHVVEDVWEASQETAGERSVRGPVERVEVRGSGRHVVVEHDGGAVVERVRERRLRVEPLEAVAAEVERAEER